MSEIPSSRRRRSAARPSVPAAEAREWQLHQRAMKSRLDQIAKVERQIVALQARQVELTASFVTERTRFDEDHGFLADNAQYRGMLAEVAIAKRVSVTTAAGFMDDAYQLATSHPATMKALKTGRLGLPAARSIARETVVLDDPEAKSLADTVIAEEAVDLLPGKVRAMAERRVAEIDPDAVERRSRRERADKHLTLNPAGSGMAWLGAYLPAEHAAAAYNSVQEHARSVHASGQDTRSVSHIMCDTLVERLTSTSTDALPAHVSVVMTDATLLGLSDDPAHLVGAGPLTAAAARLLATSKSAWLRRFLTDPVDGSLTQGDPKRRRFDGSLRDLATTRDQHCRGIQCASPIVDIDHIIEHAKGGKTSLHNGQGLSENCHITRDDPRMQVFRDDTTGVISWTTPSGLNYRTLPPPSLAPGSLSRSQVWNRHALLHPPNSQMEQHTTRFIVTQLRHTRSRC
jgi:uncharacterized protein DUF222